MKRALLLFLLVGCKDFEDYQKRAKRSEAELQLTKLGKAAKVAAMEKEQFPILELAATPDKPCCDFPGHKCPADAAMWTAWQPLEFAITEPFQFQYTYSSDGKTFTATAIGDLDCDRENIVYKLTGTLENGAAKTDLERPTNRD